MPHGRVADRGLAVGGHSPANPSLPARRIRLQILREDVTQRGQRALDRGGSSQRRSTVAFSTASASLTCS
jgi:hypothetical protein